MPLGHLFGHSPNLPISLTVSYLALPNLSHTHTPAFWAKRLWSLGRIRVGHLEALFLCLIKIMQGVVVELHLFWISVWLQRVGHTSRFKYFEVGNINCVLKMRWKQFNITNFDVPVGCQGVFEWVPFLDFFPKHVALQSLFYWHFEVWLHHRIVAY